MMEVANEKENPVPVMEPEQAADLAALKGMVAEAAPVPGTEPAHLSQPEPQVDLAKELQAFGTLVTHTLRPAFPSLEKTLPDETLGACCEAFAAVCKKHGWLQGGVAGDYGEEIALAMIVLPVGWSVYVGVQSDLIAKGVKPATGEKNQVIDADQVPGSKTVSFGAVEASSA